MGTPAPRSQPLPHHPFLPALSHLQTAALAIAPHSPLLSSHFAASLYALAGSKELLLNSSVLKTYCPACSTVLIPGWTVEVRSGGKEPTGISKREARKRKTSVKKRGNDSKCSSDALHAKNSTLTKTESPSLKSKKISDCKPSREMVYTCMVCANKLHLSIPAPPPVRRLKVTTTKVEERIPALSAPSAPAQPSSSRTAGEKSAAPTADIAHSTAKSRAKKRKQGGLLAELEAMKKRKKEEEERKKSGGTGGGLGGLGLMDLMKLDS